MAERHLVEDRLETVLADVREAHVHVAAGEVAITAGDCPSHLDIERISGDPLVVELTDGVLQVRYERPWLARRGRGNTAVVALTVPAPTDLVVASASANVVVAGLAGRASVRTASGDIVLDRVGGSLRILTASGDVEARQPAGDLVCQAASGDLTVVAGSPRSLSARSASGQIIVDLSPRAGGEYELATLSGDVALRLDDDASLRIDVRSMSGRIDSVFDLERPRRGPVGRNLAGSIGEGEADLTIRTLSGDVAVLRPVPA